MVLPQLWFDLSKDESNNTIQIRIRKDDRSLCKHNKSLLSDYDHDIIIDEKVGMDRIEEYKWYPEGSEEDSDWF